MLNKTSQNSHKRKSYRGSYSLEFALLIPVLMTILFVAFDINTALQSYNSLQEGVQKALRCAYPTDGDCTHVLSAPPESEKIFEVSRVEPIFNWHVDYYDYSGVASFIPQDVYSLSGSANVVSTVSYSYREPTPPLMKQQGDVPIIIQTRVVPFLSGDQVDPNFGTADQSGDRNNYPESFTLSNAYANSAALAVGQNPPPASTHASFIQLKSNLNAKNGDVPQSIFNISGSTSSAGTPVSIGETDYQIIPRPFGDDVKCFKANQANTAMGGSSTPDLSKECDKNNAQILIHVKGTTTATEGTGGKVLMYLDIKGSTEDRPLGGRLISNVNSHDDFAARGLTGVTCVTNANNAKKTCKSTNSQDGYIDTYEDEATLHADLLVPYGKEFRIKFKIESEDKNDVTWRADDIKIYTSTFANGWVKDIQCSDWVDADTTRTNCPISHIAGYSAISLKEAKVARRAGINQKPEIRVDNQPCPSNYGTSNLPRDCASICGVPSGLDFVAQPRCQTARVNFDSRAVLIDDCRKLPISHADYFADFVNYPDRELNKTKLEPVKMNTGGVKPSVYLNNLKLAEPRKYNCFDAKERTYDTRQGDYSDERPRLPSDSIFLGTHQKLGEGWKETLRAAAATLPENISLKPSEFFEPKEILHETKTFTELPANAQYTQTLMPNTKVIRIGRFEESALPAECSNGAWICKLKFVAFKTAPAEATGLDARRAENRGREEVQAFFPKAQFAETCATNSRYCTTMKLEEINGDQAVRVSATMSVPTMIGEVLGFGNFNLSYSDSHTLENTYSK